jgi:hypothetical protein
MCSACCETWRFTAVSKTLPSSTCPICYEVVSSIEVLPKAEVLNHQKEKEKINIWKSPHSPLPTPPPMRARMVAVKKKPTLIEPVLPLCIVYVFLL